MSHESDLQVASSANIAAPNGLTQSSVIQQTRKYHKNDAANDR
jgi:hypothetical protein